MVKDLFERIQNNKGPLGKWASQAEGYFVFPKLEGELGPRMKFQGKDILNWSLNDYFIIFFDFHQKFCFFIWPPYISSFTLLRSWPLLLLLLSFIRIYR